MEGERERERKEWGGKRWIIGSRDCEVEDGGWFSFIVQLLIIYSHCEVTPINVLSFEFHRVLIN